jgi:DNA polymerase III sliding clamp (beta) subunit (PCNA family)
MSEKTATNREALIKVANLVRPALASAAYIPSLTHIRFDGDYATAYNDVSAISVRAKVDVVACLPGELLIKTLNSFGAESLLFQEAPKEQALVISSGRSKMKLPTLNLAAFPLELPDPETAEVILLDASILKGIERCLVSIGNDPTHPAQMGVTLDVDSKSMAVLFSTDNFTISRYQTKSKIDLPGDSPLILPSFFCQQLVALNKAFPEDDMDLLIFPGALLVEFGKSARLFTKTLVDLEPLDFPKIVGKHCKLESLKDKLAVIPDSWDASFNRALLVLSGEVDKLTKVTVGDGVIKLKSTSSLGDSDDAMSFDGEGGDVSEPIHLDPSLVVRASKVCGLMNFGEKVLTLSDQESQFIHLIAYCSR